MTKVGAYGIFISDVSTRQPRVLTKKSGVSDMALTDRKTKILQAIIDDYILTGIPVGSRTLSKRADLKLSSATIRNEMADLEEEGYLEQPHTSAGRMPSDKAYRLYVDTLMRVGSLSTPEREHIKAYYDEKMGEMEAVVNATAKVLSDVTHMTSLVLPPQIDRTEIKRIQIVKLSEVRGLLLFVFNTGLVKDTVIPLEPGMDESYLEMISNVLTEKVANQRLAEAVASVRSMMSREISEHRRFMESLLDIVQSRSRQSQRSIVLGGANNIFNHPEYRDLERARGFLQLLETKDVLYNLLDSSMDMEFTIKIGHENGVDEPKDMSVITATYRAGNDTIGSFGVIGPTRMDYARVLSVMNYIGESINHILSNMLKPDG